MYQQENNQTTTLKDLPVLRQSFIVAALMIWGGLALAWFISLWFLLLPAMVGGGLFLAGVTGFCPMVAILEQLPFNRRSR